MKIVLWFLVWFGSSVSEAALFVESQLCNTVFAYFGKLKSGAVSKRLSLKPLGTYNAVENELTTPKSAFGQTMLKS